MSETPLTADELQAIRALLEAIPNWRAWRYEANEDDGVHVTWEHVWGPRCSHLSGAIQAGSSEDRQLIANAPNDIARLLATIDALQQERDALEERLYDARHDAAREAMEKHDGR